MECRSDELSFTWIEILLLEIHSIWKIVRQTRENQLQNCDALVAGGTRENGRLRLLIVAVTRVIGVFTLLRLLT
jgi:hypothetical protein